jgi:hypothetical protein
MDVVGKATMVRHLRGGRGGLPRPTAVVAALLLLLCAFASFPPAWAGEGPWIVAELTGSAFSRPGDAANAPWQALRRGAPVGYGSVVRTDASGQLVLANGVDRIRMGANSELELPAVVGADGVTRVIHWIGTVVFQVGKRPTPQFEVDTPYLVAIVKGTRFTTTVSAAGASVDVDEGVVGVATRAGGDATDLAAGQAASVSSAAPDKVAPGSLAKDSAGVGDAAPVGGSGDDGVADAGAAEADRGRGHDGGKGGGNGNAGDRAKSGRGKGKGNGNGQGNGHGDCHGNGNGCGGCGQGHGNGNGHDRDHDGPDRGRDGRD